MRLTANFQLHGAYGDVGPDESFECPDEISEILLKNNQARIPDPPRVIYETKVVAPPEVGPIIPFSDSAVSDAQQEELASDSDSVLSESDSSESGASNSGRRRGRIGFSGKS
jgi:hypothetical protein